MINGYQGAIPNPQCSTRGFMIFRDGCIRNLRLADGDLPCWQLETGRVHYFISLEVVMSLEDQEVYMASFTYHVPMKLA